MATLSLDFDSKGDVELVLEEESDYISESDTDSDDESDKGDAQSEDVEVKEEEIENDATAAEQALHKDADPKKVVVRTPEKDSNPVAASPAARKRTFEHLNSRRIGLINVKVVKYHLRVSAAKLVSSSRVFESMLKGPSFREGVELQEKGFVRLDLDDDPTAMMVVLGILHGNDAATTTVEEFEDLFNLAVVTDKYQLHAVVAPHASIWIDDYLKHSKMLEGFSNWHLSCLWMTWVFGAEKQFRALSIHVMQSLTKSIDATDPNVKLPGSIVDTINKRRRSALQKIEDVLKKHQEGLLGMKFPDEDNVPENNMLRYMAFGHGTVCAKELRLGEFAVPDHCGISIRNIRSLIKAYPSLEGFEAVNANDKKSNPRSIIPGGSLDLKSALKAAVKEFRMDRGLKYDYYKPTV
ncbi:hypothetical protein BT63DRAFT_267690 [Microthyrium microscopicum]|uniref:BTB domain-containing protein n=1 Tax=Microthyrium microscopicum TaxID=703497 RepID=A0A6A6UFR0_9PEZI|nr:hypothetical protein BT63DRAFT_267690 [Microthyrium microscopicum]